MQRGDEMKLGRRLAMIVAAALVLIAWTAPALADTFQAGAARADITPDVERWEVNSIGYFSQKVMTSVNDPQFCEALAVSDGADEAVIVTCDLMGTPPALREKVLEGLDGTGIDDRNLLITCSHTHSGPGNMMPNFIARIGFGPYIEELTQWTADQIVEAIQEAQASMRPAVVRVSHTELVDVTRNRRDPAGSYNYDTRRFSDDYDPNEPTNVTDPTLTVIKIDGTDGKPIALMFHFATHGTVLGAEVTYLSADWSGAAKRIVGERAPGYVAMYMNGAQGDQAPTMKEDAPYTDLEYLEVIGAQVADGVDSIVNKGEVVGGAPVRSIMVRRNVPPGNSLMGIKVPRWLVKRYFSELPLQAVRMGDVVFMALPVEAVSEIGLTMKAGAKGVGAKYPLVAGLSNDHLLYAAMPDDFEEGGYEVDNTAMGIIEAGLIIGEQMMMVRKLYQQED